MEAPLPSTFGLSPPSPAAQPPTLTCFHDKDWFPSQLRRRRITALHLSQRAKALAHEAGHFVEHALQAEGSSCARVAAITGCGREPGLAGLVRLQGCNVGKTTAEGSRAARSRLGRSSAPKRPAVAAYACLWSKPRHASQQQTAAAAHLLASRRGSLAGRQQRVAARQVARHSGLRPRELLQEGLQPTRKGQQLEAQGYQPRFGRALMAAR